MQVEDNRVIILLVQKSNLSLEGKEIRLLTVRMQNSSVFYKIPAQQQQQPRRREQRAP